MRCRCIPNEMGLCIHRIPAAKGLPGRRVKRIIERAAKRSEEAAARCRDELRKLL